VRRCAGLAASTLLAQLVYDVPANVILDSAARAISGWDIITSMIKAWVFGVIISVVRVHVLAGTAIMFDQVRNQSAYVSMHFRCLQAQHDHASMWFARRTC